MFNLVKKVKSSKTIEILFCICLINFHRSMNLHKINKLYITLNNKLNKYKTCNNALKSVYRILYIIIKIIITERGHRPSEGIKKRKENMSKNTSDGRIIFLLFNQRRDGSLSV